ncbi:MAG: GrpB family protein, partial [Alphaproteobacteria bacterium]|nr:GrpB family protein [Alphaproteobacteria bacterium]
MSKHKKIEVTEYNSEWPAMFKEEKNIITEALGDNCVSIHHVGSTSVPGLIAKPKIDIIAIANDREKAITDLEKVEYMHQGEWNIPLKCGFAKRTGIHVNLHMFFEENHPEVELNLAFRDYLRTHEDAKIAYGNLKREILSNEENATKRVQVGALSFPFYTLQKRAFIDNVLRKIGFNRLRVIKCLTDIERNYAENFYISKIGENAFIDFSNEDHEHFILYKGVEICGYANLQISPTPKIILMECKNAEDKTFFQSVIQKWINVHFGPKITLIKATEKDADLIHQMQIESFYELHLKYRDDETNPVNESTDKILQKLKQTDSHFYLIKFENNFVGGIRIVVKNNRKRIS